MPIESEITHFIDNQQVAVGNLFLYLQQPAAIQRLYQFVREIWAVYLLDVFRLLLEVYSEISF